MKDLLFVIRPMMTNKHRLNTYNSAMRPTDMCRGDDRMRTLGYNCTVCEEMSFMCRLKVVID